MATRGRAGFRGGAAGDVCLEDAATHTAEHTVALEGPPGHHVRRVPGNRRRHPPPTAAFKAQCRPRAAQSPRSPCALAAFPAACPLSAVFAVCLSVLKLLAFSAIDEGKGLSLL